MFQQSWWGFPFFEFTWGAAGGKEIGWQTFLHAASSDALPRISCGGEPQRRAVVEGEVLEEEENEDERHSILLFLVSTPQPPSSCSERAGAEEPVVAQEQCLSIVSGSLLAA